MPLVMLLVLLGPLILVKWDLFALKLVMLLVPLTFLHLNAISYAFSSAGTINFS